VSTRISLSIIRDPSGRIRQLIRELGADGRRELNAGAAATLWADVRAHVRRYAAGHHASANRLGAMPTGHLEQAAATMQRDADADGGYVSIDSPGFRRVFGIQEIRPSRARALTIPIHAIAYGRRVAEVSRYHRVFRPRGKSYLAANIDGTLTPLYALRKSVSIPQDRTMLPTDEQLGESVRRGYMGVIRATLAKIGVAS